MTQLKPHPFRLPSYVPGTPIILPSTGAPDMGMAEVNTTSNADLAHENLTKAGEAEKAQPKAASARPKELALFRCPPEAIFSDIGKQKLRAIKLGNCIRIVPQAHGQALMHEVHFDVQLFKDLLAFAEEDGRV